MNDQRRGWVTGTTGTRYLVGGVVLLVLGIALAMVGFSTPHDMWLRLIGSFLATVGTGMTVRVVAGRSMTPPQ